VIEKIYVKIPASMKLHECLEVTKNFFLREKFGMRFRTWF
jgi:hypothetical protein